MWVMRRRQSGGGTGLSWASMVTGAAVVYSRVVVCPNGKVNKHYSFI